MWRTGKYAIILVLHLAGISLAAQVDSAGTKADSLFPGVNHRGDIGGSSVVQLDNAQEETAKNVTVSLMTDTMKLAVVGYPVIGPSGDTLLFIYSKIGESTPEERADRINTKIKKLYEEYPGEPNGN